MGDLSMEKNIQNQRFYVEAEAADRAETAFCKMAGST